MAASVPIRGMPRPTATPIAIFVVPLTTDEPAVTVVLGFVVPVMLFVVVVAVEATTGDRVVLVALALVDVDDNDEDDEAIRFWGRILK